MTLREAWRAGQEGWPRSFPLAQFPNPPLLVAGAGWVVAALSDGDVHDAGRAVFAVGLSAWACLELTEGANWARRLLGAVVLVATVVRLTGDA